LVTTKYTKHTKAQGTGFFTTDNTQKHGSLFQTYGSCRTSNVSESVWIGVIRGKISDGPSFVYFVVTNYPSSTFTFQLQAAPALLAGPMAAPARLILASASPRRRELLANLGVKFDVVVADVTEHEDPSTEPKKMVAHNAALKADWVAERHPDAWVLGADTTVFIDRTVLNKPRDLAEAREMLKRLSGRTHTVFTGVALRRVRDGVKVDEGVASEVTFKPFDDPVIDAYFKLVNPLDKAGAYGIQEGRELIIAGWEGSFTNIMGLPMEATKQILTTWGLVG
jgi:septum formation protein